jgi:hypothetical protein
VQRTVRGDPLQGRALRGGEDLLVAVLGHHLGGDDLAVGETGRQGAGRLTALVQEAQIRRTAHPALQTALAPLGGVGDALVQTPQQVDALDEHRGERHRRTHHDQGHGDEEHQADPQRAPAETGAGPACPALARSVHASVALIACPTPRTVRIIGARPLSIFKRRRCRPRRDFPRRRTRRSTRG